MTILQAAILGIIQGLTEFLPISSSAHLVIVPWLFGWADPAVTSLSFDVALHLGTLAAVLVFFWKDLSRYIVAWFKSVIRLKIGDDTDRRMAWFLLLSSVPGAIAGVLFESAVEGAFHSNPIGMTPMLLMAGIIALLGGILWLADSLAGHTRPFGAIGIKDSILIGLAQAFAIFPGVSRSGATITCALALGLDRVSAARFSFLLSAPIIAGAGIKSLADLAGEVASGVITGIELFIFPIGFISAAVTGFLCIKFFLAFLQKHSFAGFAIYRFALAILVFVAALLRG